MNKTIFFTAVLLVAPCVAVVQASEFSEDNVATQGQQEINGDQKNCVNPFPHCSPGQLVDAMKREWGSSSFDTLSVFEGAARLNKLPCLARGVANKVRYHFVRARALGLFDSEYDRKNAALVEFQKELVVAENKRKERLRKKRKKGE